MGKMLHQKTNWKYISIIVIVAIIVGGGILGYYYFLIKDLEMRLVKIELRLPEKVIEDETANWKIYRSEKYNFEFKYPKNWEFKKFHHVGSSLEMK